MKNRTLLTMLLYFFLMQNYAQDASRALLVRSTVGVSGSTEILKSQNVDYVVQQSIGQASVIGTFFIGNLTVRQGFIQPNVWAKIVNKKIPTDLEVVVYPNPFVESISLLFHENVTDKVKVEIYDLVGRLIFANSYAPSQNINVILSNVPVANYILIIQANQKQSIKKILKKQ